MGISKQKRSKRMKEPVCCDEETSTCEPCSIDEMIHPEEENE